jgi:FKBP-type peptidyl-prolyl cis-trans isomerase
VTVETTTFAPALDVNLAAMRRLSSGVYVRDIAVGEGPEVGPNDQVSLHYAGWLSDGTQFDATVPPSTPLSVRLGEGNMIKGWERGIPGMRVGGQRQLVVPPSMGYGSARRPNIPPRSVLVFVIEVVSRPD